VRRTFLLALLLPTLALAACGNGKPSTTGDNAGKYKDADVTSLFERAAGEQLVAKRSASFDFLSLPETSSSSTNSPIDRYGAFTIYVVKQKKAFTIFKQDDNKKEIKPDANGVYWQRTASGGYEATRFYDNVVLTWIAGDQRKLDARWKRLTTILANLGKPADQLKLPPEDTPCAKQNIDPVGPGKEGTCKLGNQTLTIVNRDSTLKLAPASLSDVELKIGKAIVSRRFGLVQRLRPREGAYVLVKYRLKNAGNKPLDSFEAGLQVGDKLYASDDRVAFEVQPGEDPFPLQPDSKRTIVTAFDVPASVAKQVKRMGALEVSADTESTSLDLSNALGRIRLSAAHTGA
jgi:hypothetical protein